MPVWYSGGVGEISPIVIKQSSIELEDRETGWVYMENFDIPDEAFLAAENDDEEFFIGRATVDGELVVGMIAPDIELSHFTNNGKAHNIKEKQILCGYYLSWAQRLPEKIHPRAVIGGRTIAGEAIYIGKGLCAGMMVIGKIIPSKDRKLFVAHQGHEIALTNYVILVHGS